MLTIIIPSLNSPLIDEVIAALQHQTLPMREREIIVVGQDKLGKLNGTTGITFINTPTPISAAAARNIGARRATGEHLLFIDADCIAAPDWAERLHTCLQHGHAVVGGRVEIEPERSAYWTLCDNLLTLTSSLADDDDDNDNDNDHQHDMWYLPSLNFGITRALFLTMHGFDEAFPGAAGEDVDLSLRLRQRGIALHYEPHARITHRPPRSTARAMWRHLFAFGRAHDRIQQLHGAFRPSPLNRLSPRWYPLIALAAPILAVNDVRHVFRQTPLARQHPSCLFGLWWGKLAWYAGLVQAMHQRATQRS